VISNKLIDKIFKFANDNIHLPVSEKKHFSFIVHRKKIIAYGYNQAWKTHRLAARFKHRFSCRHSELHCLINFPYPIEDLNKFKLVNIRLHKDGTIGASKPCQFCQQMLSEFNINKVYYSTGSGEFLAL